MQYKTIQANYDIELWKQVDAHLRLGWQCQGGVSVFIKQIGHGPNKEKMYYQAMVRDLTKSTLTPK